MNTSRAAGFTLIELLVVLAILGVLAAAALPLGEAVLRAQQERELRAALWQIRDALDDYKRAVDAGTIARVTESGYPPDLGALVNGVADLRKGHGGRSVYFLRRIPRDPFASPLVPPEATWLPRSYQSPSDRPMPGPDVFDVRSSSHAAALDGSAYASW